MQVCITSSILKNFSEKGHHSWQSSSCVASVSGRRGSWPHFREPPICHSYPHKSDVPYHRIQELFSRTIESRGIVRKLEVRSAANSTSAERTEVFTPILSFRSQLYHITSLLTFILITCRLRLEYLYSTGSLPWPFDILSRQLHGNKCKWPSRPLPLLLMWRLDIGSTNIFQDTPMVIWLTDLNETLVISQKEKDWLP